MRGSLDSKWGNSELNFCKDCGNEWAKIKADYTMSYKAAEMMLGNLYYALLYHREFTDCKFDPLDVKEKFNSLEEKRAKAKTEADDWGRYAKHHFGGLCLDTLKEFVSAQISRVQIRESDTDYLVNVVGVRKNWSE